jgi:hypothetical protein
MATVVKDFKIKSGLVVEGTTGTINTYDILTKKQADQDYIIGLIGGTATSTNTADAVVKRDSSGNFAAGTITADLTGDVTGNVTGDVTGDLTGNVTGDVSGNAGTATALETARTIAGQTFDGTQNVVIAPTDLDGVTATAAELNILDGATLSTSELNILDGATVTASELNILDGATITTTELNYLDGVTSAVQTQLSDLAQDIANIEADTGLADHAAATSGVHGVSGDVVGTTDAQTLSNKTLGSNLDADGNKVTGLATPTSDNDAATKKYVDDEVAALVGSAPELLDTLQELAAAIDNDPDTINNLQSLAAGKQDALTAGANIDITGATISVTGLDTADVAEDSSRLYFTDTRAKDAVSSALGDGIEYVDGAFDVQVGEGLELGGGTGNQVVVDRDTVDTWYDANGAAGTAEQNAKDYADTIVETLQGVVDELSTDDVSEGANLYYTESRAKTDAAELLTGATLTNITITGNGSGLTITAENGVADSDTDDLEEGTTNLYFTDVRAVDALEAVVPNFTAVEFNSVAKQVAATASVATASTSNALTWAKVDYRSAEFLVKIKSGTHTEVSKLVLTMDTSDNIAITEYAMVGTNGDLGSYSASVSGDNVALTVTTLNNNSEVMVVGTLLK